MTIEQLNYLLRKELYAIKNHKDNIDRIKKEYFDSNYGLKEGDKIRILHEEMYDTFVWITDTCLQDGKIRKVKAKIEDYDGTLLADTPGRFTPYTIGYQAFKSKEEALKYAEEQRTDLIKSLKLQIHELENLKFEYDD